MPAHAQAPESPQVPEDVQQAEQLGELIVVQGQPLPLPRLPAPHTAQQRDPTAAVTLLPVEAQRLEARDTAEVLATAPGVSVQDLGGYGQAKSLSVRGAASNGVLVLLDGIPLQGAGGIADLSRIPLPLVQRFELLRGAAGARYGTGALGGVVNVVTREAGEHPWAGLTLTGGSFGTLQGELAAAGSALGGTGLLLVHAGGSRGDFPYLFDPAPSLPGNALEERKRQNNDAGGGGGLAKYRRELSPGLALDVLAEGQADERGLAGSAQNPSSTRERSRHGSLALALTRSEGAHTQLYARGYAHAERLEQSSGGESLGAQTHAVGGVELDARTRAGLHGLSANASVGAEGVPGAATWLRLSLMAQDELQLLGERLLLAPSVRVERAGPYTLFSPKLGLLAKLYGPLRLRANVGQAHRAPSFYELYVRAGTLLPNPSLRPERALHADAALVYEGTRGSAAVGPFVALYEDLIAYELYPPFAARPVNFASARSSGLEAEGELRPWADFLRLSASYTLLFSTNLKDDPRYYLKDLPYRPRHALSARVSGGPRWLSASLEVAAQSKQYFNRTEELVLPARAFVHAGVHTTLGRAPEVTLGLAVKNLFDVRTQDFDGYPLPGRSVYATLALALGGRTAQGTDR
ncbi:TonB-dependent receptor [Aggregicoccus sp. 17bor-14]|nr:TonB-dependent receptor [Simulacricoccus sp. 17bor-14]MRI87712.1 TonB-dependent receptor [Aggregicoccus sp. 17bor-14]